MCAIHTTAPRVSVTRNFLNEITLLDAVALSCAVQKKWDNTRTNRTPAYFSVRYYIIINCCEKRTTFCLNVITCLVGSHQPCLTFVFIAPLSAPHENRWDDIRFTSTQPVLLCFPSVYVAVKSKKKIIMQNNSISMDKIWYSYNAIAIIPWEKNLPPRCMHSILFRSKCHARIWNLVS